MNFQIERLRRLPQRPKEVWQGGLVKMPAWVQKENQEPYRPWSGGWVSINTKYTHFTDPTPPQAKSPELALNALADFACDQKLAGYRPAKLQVLDPGLAEYLAGLLTELNITVEHRNKLFILDEVLAHMTESLSGRPLLPNALDAKGVTAELMRAFAQAACEFYQAKPWEHLMGEDLIEIETPFVDSALRYVSVLGAGGETFGLGFYDSVGRFEEYMQPKDEMFVLADKQWSVYFEPITNLSFADADLWEDHNLPVAGKDAYPVAVCWEQNGKHRRPGPGVLAFLSGLMSALAHTTEAQMDSARWQQTVNMPPGPMQFTLSLPDLLEQGNSKRRVRKMTGRDVRLDLERTLVEAHRALVQGGIADSGRLNKFFEDKSAGRAIPGCEPRTPLEKAQDLAYDALGSYGRRQLRLARKALETCPDCADAYLVLGERTCDVQKARDLYAQGVAAGERSLGKECFEENAGHFWGVLHTRPYMRARLGLAQCLEQLGKIDEAAEHYRDMLRLNPNDNQAVRHLLLVCLLKLNKDDEARELLKKYRGDYALALWCYARALLAFRQKGDTALAHKHLQKALEVNDYVPDYILGYEDLPPDGPVEYGLGSDEEAMICTSLLKGVWTLTTGAIEWLEKYADEML